MHRDGRAALALDPTNTGGRTISHGNDRAFMNEHENTHGYTGGKTPKPKHGGGLTPTHGAMFHRDHDTGKLYVGITPTSVALAIATAPLGESNPLWPEERAKSLTPPMPAFGQAEKNTSHEHLGQSMAEHGNQVLREGHISSGDWATHPDKRGDRVPAHVQLGQRTLLERRASFKRYKTNDGRANEQRSKARR